MANAHVNQEMKELYKEIAAEVMKRLGQLLQGAEPELRQIKKNNDLELTGLVIREPGDTVAPTIYLDGYAEQIRAGKMTIEDAAKSIVQTYQEHVIHGEISKDALFDKKNLFCEVVNKDMNRDLLSTVPHEDIEDVSVIVRCEVAPNASYVVKNEHLGLYGYTPSELLDHAKRNTYEKGMEVKSMGEVLREMMGAQADEILGLDVPMLVITNEEKTYGAALPFFSKEARQQIYDRVGGDYYIIPSSIHECLAIPADGKSAEDIKGIIGEVNSTELRQEEILGTQPYLVDKSMTIKLACKEALQQAVQQTQHYQRSAHM